MQKYLPLLQARNASACLTGCQLDDLQSDDATTVDNVEPIVGNATKDLHITDLSLILPLYTCIQQAS